MARQKRRNGHAFHPIMRKGGVHAQSKSGKRAAAKRDTQRKLSEWLGRSSILRPPQAVLLILLIKSA